MHNTAHTKYGAIPQFSVQIPLVLSTDTPIVLSTDKDIPHETIPCYGPEKVILNINIMLYVSKL